jgi:hypothetical protein
MCFRPSNQNTPWSGRMTRTYLCSIRQHDGITAWAYLCLICSRAGIVARIVLFLALWQNSPFSGIMARMYKSLACFAHTLGLPLEESSVWPYGQNILLATARMVLCPNSQNIPQTILVHYRESSQQNLTLNCSCSPMYRSVCSSRQT